MMRSRLPSVTTGRPSRRTTRPRYRWLGDDVEEFSGSLDEISDLLPTFRRQTLALPSLDGTRSVVNWDRHLIVREPRSSSDDAVPIAVVSPRYQLVQHATVLDHAARALEAAKIPPGTVDCAVSLTTRGERMALRVKLPDAYSVDPGDGHPMALRLECFNSVDGSMKFSAFVGWLRLVCSNGLVVMTPRVSMRERHDEDFAVERIGAVLAEGLGVAETERALYADWIGRHVEPNAVAKWVDERVASAWGKKAAARAYHIVQTGHDGAFAEPFERATPSSRRMTTGAAVPGAKPGAWNAYAVAQALAWLARERTDVQEQLERAREIPNLMRHLLN